MNKSVFFVTSNSFLHMFKHIIFFNYKISNWPINKVFIAKIECTEKKTSSLDKCIWFYSLCIYSIPLYRSTTHTLHHIEWFKLLSVALIDESLGLATIQFGDLLSNLVNLQPIDNRKSFFIAQTLPVTPRNLTLNFLTLVLAIDL